MEYAIIRTGGRQFKVSPGDELLIPYLGTKTDEIISFEVLLVATGGSYTIGKPIVEGTQVKAKVLGTQKGEKIRVARFMSKVRHRRVHGHRDILTKVKIQEIVTGGKTVKQAEKKEAAAPKKTAVKRTIKK